MIYIEYEECLSKYRDIQNKFDDLLCQKEQTLNQPWLDPNHEDILDKDLASVRQILIDRVQLVKMKEEELRKSQDKYDRIYVNRFLDGYGMNRLARVNNYSKSQIYRILEQIKARCDKMRQKPC